MDAVDNPVEALHRSRLTDRAARQYIQLELSRELQSLVGTRLAS